MIEKFCLFLTNIIKKNNSEIDEERAEIINYGLQLLIGEIPKMIITLILSFILGILKLTIIAILIIMPYRAVSGGFHMKSHLGCIIVTNLFYCGIPKISEYIYFHNQTKIIFVLCALILGIIMIKFYAPADTENVPILREKERKQKKFFSYIFYITGLMTSLLVKDDIIFNIIFLGYFVQTLMITPIAYKITNNKYGYEIYKKSTSETIA